MRHAQKYYLPVGLVAAASILVLALFLAGSYRRTVSLVKERFYAQQKLSTRQTALSIEKNFTQLVRESELLARELALVQTDPVRTRAAMQRTFDYARRFAVNDISLANRDGIITQTLSSPDLVGRDFSFRQYFKQLREAGAPEPVFEQITFQGFRKGRKGIIIARSVRGAGGEFLGPLVLVVEVGDMIGSLFGQLPPGTRGWVIDADGLVLYHPALDPGSRLDAGVSRDPTFTRFVDGARSGNVDRGEYFLTAGAPHRTMATAATVQVAGKPLTVILETPEDAVYGYLQDFQTYNIIGVGLSMLAVFASLLLPSALLLRTNRALVREAATREQAEERQRESEANFQLLIEYSPIAMAIVDREDRFIYLNRAFTETLGYDLAAIPDVGHWLTAAYPDPSLRRAMTERWERFRTRGEIRPGPRRPSEYPVVDARGESRTLDIHGARIGNRFLIVFNDLTERHRLEHQLRHSQKMDCFGRLAAGVAHDFNNILSVIMGYAEILQRRFGRDDPGRASTDVILGAVTSAAKLTGSLLAFSRKQILNPQIFTLGELVTGVERLLSRLIGEDIRIETAVDTGEIAVFADYGQLEQVLINLGTNARDAMPQGGTIRIATGVETLDAEAAARTGAGRAGDYATITFSDTGVGMDERTLEQIFEPFFTTKEVGRGTGLGLAIVYGIVKQHGGGIDVASHPDAGTTFKIHVPLFVPEPVAEERREEEAAEVLGRGETILLAEDDPMVRQTVVKMLESGGYRVQVAADGDEAARIYRALGGDIALLIFDVIMPKKSGVSAYEEIRSRWGNVNVLFLSGYAPDLVRREGRLTASLPFLQKPVSRKTLLRKVREILDRGTQAPPEAQQPPESSPAR